MNTPNIAANDIGNGNSKERAKLIPNDIPIHNNWLVKNCLLLLLILNFLFHYIIYIYSN